MKRGQEKLMSHILMVVAPLLVLFMITVAWFISSRTISMSEMSFAAQDSGPGASLYPEDTLGERNYDGATLVYDSISWGEKLAPEKSDITIEALLPGQCVYYLLASDKEFVPRLLNVKITDGDGKELAGDARPTDLLPQCLGLYLIPTRIDLAVKPLVSNEVKVIFSGEDKTGAAFFQDGADSAQFPAPEKPTTENTSKAYILAIFCDPTYGQNGPGPEGPGKPGSNGIHQGVLPGSVSFSLTFDKVSTEEP